MNSRHPQGRYNTGEVRGETPQEGHWYEDRTMGREISRDFTAASGMVPTNPNNFYAAKAKPSEFRYDAIADGLTSYVSPYGDGRQFLRQEEPTLTTPGPAANMVAAAAPAKGAADQSRTPGYGFGAGSRLAQIDGAMQQNPAAPMAAEQAPTLGMSTGISLGGGPKRNVPKPA
jgi:hypothetical protein